MLIDDTYTILLMTKMRREVCSAEFDKIRNRTADQLRMASFLKKNKPIQLSKAVTFILHGTGKALINTGNRLLKIA